jgi:hypothetical protein
MEFAWRGDGGHGWHVLHFVPRAALASASRGAVGWGLVAALIVAVAELAVVAPLFYLLNAYHVFPDQFAGEPPPRVPMEIMRRGYERSAVAWVHLVALVVVPAAAALVGGALSVVWSVVVAARQALAERRMNPQ